MRTLAILAAAALGLAGPALAQGPAAPATDYVKRAGNFIKHCDARADETGKRPEANYVCLAFMAGLVEGYTVAAIANGNKEPYCLPRPATLAELADMMVTVIERGVPDQTPTAAVFHNLMQTSFPCPDKESALDRPFRMAQLQVTTPQELEAESRTLPIITPSQEAREPTLPIVEPARTQTGTIPSGGTTDSTPGGNIQSPTPPSSVGRGAPDGTDTTAAGIDPGEPLVRSDGTSPGISSARGPGSAVGPQSELGYPTSEGVDSELGRSSELGGRTAEGVVRVPLTNEPRDYIRRPGSIVVDPLDQWRRRGFTEPQTPRGPRSPRSPRPATEN